MAGELRATLLTAVKGDAINKLKKDLDGIGGSLRGLGSMAASAVKGFAGFATAIGATKFITGSIDQAKLLEQTYRSLETVFGPLTGEMQKFAEGATKIGLSQTEAAKASIFIGGVLQQYGVAQDKAAESTQRLVSLAADLSFVYGYDVQEALLGMTALFRGEYDPIEKFGVAMKQNEIESIKAARGLGNLTGAAEMNADVLIRQELLFQRTGKSLGAFTENADTLAVQQEVLRATFENLQATIGQELSPVITQFFSDLIPIIEQAGPGLVRIFEVVAEVLKGLADIFIDLFDPTTNLGDSVLELGLQFNSLWETIFGRDFNIAQIFEAANHALSFIIDSVKNVIKFIETLIIYTQSWGEYIQAIIDLDWEKIGAGVDAIANKTLAARDAAIEGKKAFALLYDQISKNPTEAGDQTEIWDVLDVPKITVKPKDLGLDDGPETKTKIKDAVKDFFGNLQDEIQKQQARFKLEGLGASEGLINSILGAGEDWQKVFDKIVVRGINSVKQAQLLFNQTKAGLDEIAKARELEIEGEERFRKAMEEAEERRMQVAREMWESISELYEKSKALAEEQTRLSQEFAKTQNEIFDAFRRANAPDEELGRYASAVRNLTEELTDLVESNPFKEGEGGLFSDANRRELINSVTNIGGVIEAVARQRDAIADRLAGARSLIETVADQVLGRFNITEFKGRATSIINQVKRIVEQTRNFAGQITQLRQVGLARPLIEQILGAGAEVGGQTARAILAGGQSAVTELNSLYSDLDSIAQSMGEQSAIEMYGAGINITNGLVEGLLAQQSEIERAANQLANAFQDAFMRATEMTQIGVTVANQEQLGYAFSNPQTGSFQAAMGAAQARITQPSPVQITINAGLGTDPVALGREVTNAIRRYEQVSGRVFASA